jgi:hypothetical protein
MSSYDDNAEAPGCSRRALGIGFLSVGLIGMAFGEALLLALLLSPTALQNDASFGTYFLALFLVPICSLPVLISLFLLKVHWLLAIGAFLLPLLVAYAYGQGWLFPRDPNIASAYGVLIYGSGVIVLSLILVVSDSVVKGRSSKMPK